jgi:mannose-6-phosphate isomerase
VSAGDVLPSAAARRLAVSRDPVGLWRTSMTSQRLGDLEPLTRQPLRLSRNRVYRLWRGGAVLDRFQGQPDPADANTPEEWVGSTTVSRLPGRPADEGLSTVRLPDGSSIVLKDLIEAFPRAMLGESHAARLGPDLGVLCKLLDSAMRLPIQCHPDATFARRHLGSNFGKTEAWLILATRSIHGVPPYMLFGFREGVTETAFRRSVRAQDVTAQIASLNRVEVEPGDLYLVSAGTPHALGPGIFMIEIQEPTDLVVNTEYTFHGLRRTEAQCYLGLGFDLGMSCFNYQAVGDAYLSQHRLTPRTLRDDSAGMEERLIGPDHTPCFGMDRVTVRDRLSDGDRGRCYIGIVTEGQGRLTGARDDFPVRAGDTFFVPAASEHAAVEAKPGESLRLIKCFPPDLRGGPWS